MRIARITGRVSASVKSGKLIGVKTLVADYVDPDGKVLESSAVVTDACGAGPGDLVLVTGGSAIGIIDKVVEEYETYKVYSMNIACDYALGTLYVDFGKDVLGKQMGWKSTVSLQEDTAFGVGVQEFIAEILESEVGIKVLDTIVYDTQTVGFAPI